MTFNLMKVNILNCNSIVQNVLERYFKHILKNINMIKKLVTPEHGFLAATLALLTLSYKIISNLIVFAGWFRF